MNIFDEIKRLQDRVELINNKVVKLENNQCKPKEKPDASINSMDNKDLPNGSDTKASSSDTGGLPSKKLKKQTRRQTVGKSKTTSGKKVNGKTDHKTKQV